MKTPSKSPKTTKRRFRMKSWFSLRIGADVFGIETHHNGSWIVCAIGDIPVLHTDDRVVERWMRWLRDPEGTRSEWEGDGNDVPTETILTSIKDVFSSLATRH